MRAALPIVACAALLLAGGACDKKKSDPNGVGPWQFGKSKLADAEAAGRCLPGDGVVQCVGLSGIQIGKQAAQTDLYFKSNAKDAPLIEISLIIRACDAEAAGAALEQVIGPPTSASKDNRAHFWKWSTMFVAAQLPAKGSIECLISFVEPKDEARIAELQAGQ
jgi:hypothetical protein